MNSTEAKQIPLTDFLKVDVTGKEEIWITSPFNPEEKTASFKINTSKNVWYDFARGEGGNILDLVMALNNCDFKEALKRLSNNHTFSFSQAKKIPSSNHTESNDKKNYQQEINKIQSLENPALVSYLESRKINIDIAKIYLKEIYYTQKDKKYFALAFENDSLGFETRNPYFKGCIGSKNITTIKGREKGKLSIFEGFIDFLSALTHFETNFFKSDVIILNSVSNKKKLEELLYSDLYNKVYLFLDNDKAGNETKSYLYNINNNCIDCSNLYKDYKDFNCFLNLDDNN